VTANPPRHAALDPHREALPLGPGLGHIRARAPASGAAPASGPGAAPGAADLGHIRTFAPARAPGAADLGHICTFAPAPAPGAADLGHICTFAPAPAVNVHSRTIVGQNCTLGRRGTASVRL
jgi:hypothetical protein